MECQAKDEENEHEDVFHVAGEFFSSTTIHGVGRVFRKTNWFRRITWLLIFVIFVLWSVYQIGLVINDYSQFSKNINRKVVVETEVQFPAVTICHLSPIPRSPALADHQLWSPFLDIEHCYSGEGCKEAVNRYKRESGDTTENGKNVNEGTKDGKEKTTGRREETGITAEDIKEKNNTNSAPRLQTNGESKMKEKIEDLNTHQNESQAPTQLSRWRRTVGREPPIECFPGMFQCDSGQCIHSRQVCNGDGDCPDQEDERTCCWCPEHHVSCRGQCYPDHKRCDYCDDVGNCEDVQPPCGEGYFQCPEGKCIHNHFRCDAQEDCLYGEDEENCTSCKQGFLCKTGECLPLPFRCDVIKHCPGGEDETRCYRCPFGVLCKSGNCIEKKYRCRIIEPCDDVWCITCGTGYQCATGECLPSYQRCDSYKDCPQGDDEIGCDTCHDGFLCATGECLPYYDRCDATKNCPGGEDEVSCERCFKGFLCQTGECLASDALCNGSRQCPGGEDELNCECRDGFLCNTSECMDVSAICNGVSDCPGGEDETDCNTCKDGFLCVTGECLPWHARCDTFFTCPGEEDEADCETCTYGFLCEDKKCISGSSRCDGSPDCANGEDEENCKTCKEGFLCNSGLCIPRYDRCDYEVHCPDGDDEMDCNCANRFICKTGECIPFALWCNNVTNCPGGEDEQDCDRCPEGSFTCKSGQCIPDGWRCNMRNDCPDGDDEAGCPQSLYTGCPKGYFECKNGRCVMDWYHCDGKFDCVYEEYQCDTCRPGAFKCHKGPCIEGHLVCNGVPNCDEGDDETNCTDIRNSCPQGYYSCETGCFPSRIVCAEAIEGCGVGVTQLCESSVVEDKAHDVRLKCSEYYHHLIQLLGYSTQVNISVSEEDCRTLDEHEFWSPLCQSGVTCDRFGCYDTELNRYYESYASRGPMKISLICKGEQLYYEDISLYRLGGVLTSKLLKLLLEQRNTKSDLDDIRHMFRPSYADQREFGVSAEELVYSCAFDNKACDYSHFQPWRSDRHGTCYTFNGFQHNGTQPRKVIHVGPQNGLQLTLNVQVGLSLLSPERGVRVMVHDPGLMPVPEEEGFSLGPGSSSVSVTRTENQRLGRPYGKCSRTYDIPLPFEYSPQLCKQLCVEQHLRKRCDCFMGQSPVYEALEDQPKEQCEGKLPTQKLCMDTLSKDVVEDKIACDCPQSCREMTYQTQVTSSKLNDMYFNILGQARKRIPSLCSNDTELLRLQVYLGSMSYDIIQEKPAYTWESLLSNIGGSLGLFIGVSVVSVLEVIEFVWDVCRVSLKRKRSTKEVNVEHRRMSTMDKEAFEMESGGLIKCNGECETSKQVLQELRAVTTKYAELSRDIEDLKKALKDHVACEDLELLCFHKK